MATDSKKWKKNKFTILYVALGIIVLFTYIKNQPDDDILSQAETRSEVAQVLNITGSATSTYNNKFKDIKSSHSILVNDLIQLDNQTQANLYFNNDFEITFFGPASFLFEKTKDALYLIHKKGNFKLNKSNKNPFFIIKDFKTYLLKDYLDQKSKTKTNLNQQLSSKPITINNKTHVKSPYIASDSLSFNDQLDKVIAKQRTQIQKCQLNRIQDAGMITGKF